MKKNVLSLLLSVLLICTLLPAGALAAYSPPTAFDAPKDFSVQLQANDTAWDGFHATVSAPQNVRDFLDVVGNANSDFTREGYNSFTMYLQLDYKTDSGSWHYQSGWDSDFTYSGSKALCNLTEGTYSATSVFQKQEFENISDGEALPQNKGYYDSHTTDLRVRFQVHYQDVSGVSYDYFSPWSATVTYSNNQKAVDYDALINHAPVLNSVELKKNSSGKPYLLVKATEPHADIRQLNSLTGGGVGTEVWLKVGSGSWTMCYNDAFVEEFQVGVEAYLGLKDSYDAAVYQVKILYTLPYFDSKGLRVNRTSPFSNVISQGMPPYSAVSDWAKTELEKADSLGLIPASLKGADMTRPITREEFAETAVLLYEKTTGKSAVPYAPNPFTDTINPEILKAFTLKAATGTTPTTFEPQLLINREQVATMLSRMIRAMLPDGDYSTAGAPLFNDQKDISSWALPHVLFITKAGIMQGADGKFMPQAITSAQKASGYAAATREQALMMSVHTYELYH